VPLTACPLSNIRLGLFADWPSCAAAYTRLIDAGAFVTINSDDPAFFGSIGDNFAGLQAHSGLSRAELARLSKIAVDACFAPAPRKAELHALIDRFVAEHPETSA
jgi:adenosine deaminase